MLQAFLRIKQHFHGIGRTLPHRIQCLDRCLGEWPDQRVGQPVIAARRVTRGGPGVAGRRCGATIDHGLGHRHQRQAIGNAMVQACDQGRAALVMLDQAKLPQGMAHVERLHGEFGQTLLQGRLLRALGPQHQSLAHHMAFNLEVGIKHPAGTTGILLHALAEARVLQQTFLDALAHCRVSDARLDDPDPDDHHQIAGRIHAQPSRVDLAHALLCWLAWPRRRSGRLVFWPLGCFLAGGFVANFLADDSGNHKHS